MCVNPSPLNFIDVLGSWRRTKHVRRSDFLAKLTVNQRQFPALLLISWLRKLRQVAPCVTPPASHTRAAAVAGAHAGVAAISRRLAPAKLPLLIRTRYLHSPTVSLSFHRSSQPRSAYTTAAPVAPAPYCPPSYQVGAPSGRARTRTWGKSVELSYEDLVGQRPMRVCKGGVSLFYLRALFVFIGLLTSKKLLHSKTKPCDASRRWIGTHLTLWSYAHSFRLDVNH